MRDQQSPPADMLLYYLIWVAIFAGLQIWAADGDRHERTVVAVFGPALVATAFVALSLRSMMGAPAIIFFVVASLGTAVAVLPGIYRLRRGFGGLDGIKLGIAVGALTCVTTAAGFILGAGIVMLTIGVAMRGCC